MTEIDYLKRELRSLILYLIINKASCPDDWDPCDERTLKVISRNRMTNKQAQITINAIKFMLDNAQYSEDVEEALDMAIEVLNYSEFPNG